MPVKRVLCLIPIRISENEIKNDIVERELTVVKVLRLRRNAYKSKKPKVKFTSVIIELTNNEETANFVKQKKIIKCILNVNVEVLEKKKSSDATLQLPKDPTRLIKTAMLPPSA